VERGFITYLLAKPDKYLLVWAFISSQLYRNEGTVGVYEIIGKYKVPKSTLKRILEYGRNYNGFKMDIIWRNNVLLFKNIEKKVETKMVSKRKESGKSVAVIMEPVEQIVDYLNEKCGKKYKKDNKQTKLLINARIKEEFTVEDIKKVIQKKCNEWMGTEMEKYLRPQTLFGNKFESYLNQSEILHSKISNYGKNTTKRTTEFDTAIEKADRIDYSNLK
jgi:uncharacterized phage protein (TIGR02220 family)